MDNYVIMLFLLLLSALIGFVVALIWEWYEQRNYRTKDFWKRRKKYG